MHDQLQSTISRNTSRLLAAFTFAALSLSMALAQSIPASQTTTIQFKRPGAATAFKIVPTAGGIREPLTVDGGTGTWKGDMKSSAFNIKLIKSATAGGKGPEFNLLHIWWDVRFGSSTSSPPDIKREETPDGIKFTMNNLDANMEFYRSYYAWRGKARVTLIDGEPVGKPDYYKVEFFAQQLTGSDNSKNVPVAIQGTVCEGESDRVTGNDILINDQPLAIEILSARINADKELEIKYTTRGYRYGVRKIHFQSTLNGRKISRDNLITAGDFSLRFDLQEEDVPRFTKNEIAPIAMSIFPVNTLTSPVKDEKKIAVLLPVVIVPGIASTRPDHMGGDYEFPQLEQFLKERTGMITNDGSGIYLGEGYQMRRDDGYWTLSTLRYDRNRSGLAKGAGVLHKHIEEVINQTYADKVYLIAHSQGGLISRKYIQAGNGRNRVKEYLQAQTPNTGSIYAIAGQLAGDTLNYSYQYYDLMPTFPHVQLYGAFYPQEEENIELKKMNGMLPGSDPDFPKNIPYTMIVSRSEQTWWGFKIIPNIPFSNIPLYLPLFCQGDSFVPAFSQLGLERDPNNSPDDPCRTLDNLKGERVPALRGANIQVQWITGAHAPEAEMNDLIDFITPRFPSIAQYKTPSTQTQAYLELDEVKNFIWCQKLGREFGCGLR